MHKYPLAYHFNHRRPNCEQPERLTRFWSVSISTPRMLMCAQPDAQCTRCRHQSTFAWRVLGENSTAMVAVPSSTLEPRVPPTLSSRSCVFLQPGPIELQHPHYVWCLSHISGRGGSEYVSKFVARGLVFGVQLRGLPCTQGVPGCWDECLAAKAN